MAGHGSLGPGRQVSSKEVATAWPKGLVDAVSGIVPTLRPGNMQAPELDKQKNSCPNNPLLTRLGGASGVLAENSRNPALDLTTRLSQPAGSAAPSQPQLVLNSAQRGCSTMIGGHQEFQEVANMVKQLQKKAEESDRILFANFATLVSSNKSDRDEGYRVVIDKISNIGKDIATLLFKERKEFQNQIDAFKKENALLFQERKEFHNMIDACKKENALALFQERKDFHNMIDACKKENALTLFQERKEFHNKIDACKKENALLVQKHDIMRDERKESEKLLIQKHEKLLLTKVDDARKETETRVLKEHKLEMDAVRKEKEKEVLQKHSDLEAEVVKFTNMYYMVLTSYHREKEEKTITEKENAEAKQAMHAQLESLQSQLSAAKEETDARKEGDKVLLEKIHKVEAEIAQKDECNKHLIFMAEENRIKENEHAEAQQAMKEQLESQLAEAKQAESEAVTIVSQKDLELLALQSQLAALQKDKLVESISWSTVTLFDADIANLIVHD